MATVTTTPTLLSAVDFARLEIAAPMELVKGELQEMNRPGGVHGTVCSNACYELVDWARDHDGYVVITNDTGVITERNPDTVRGPDVCVIRRDRLPDGEIPDGHLSVPPEVCVEVRSPFDRWTELLAKVAEYCAAGVAEVWIIDPPSRHIHVYRGDAEPAMLRAEETLTSRELPEFRVAVSEFFRGI